MTSYTFSLDILEQTDSGSEWYWFTGDDEREGPDDEPTVAWVESEAKAIVFSEDGSFGDYAVTVTDDATGVVLWSGYEFTYTGADMQTAARNTIS